MGYPHEGILHKDEVLHMMHQASNSFSNDANFVMYVSNMMHRRSVSQAVANVFKDDPSTLEQFQVALNDPTFRELLEVAVVNPKSVAAKEIEVWLSSLMTKTGRKIPFSGQRSSAAFAEMLASNRFFGNGAQQSWKQALFYRQALPHYSNSGKLYFIVFSILYIIYYIY